MFGGEDEDDFIPASNSNLASLFGRPVEEGGNASLTYTAPKQPKMGRSDSTSQSTSQKSAQQALKIIIVKAVHTYKLEDGKYIPQGKLGGAVLGNPASRLYQLLLYKNKQQHITATKITDKFQFTVQAKNYASFYDDKGQNWSLMFESEHDAVDFAREVGIACACVPGEMGEKPFYTQDLKLGEGMPAELGDLLEIQYTTSPLTDGNLSKHIETNVNADKPQRVKIRRGVWEEALIGASRGCRRLIVLAPILFGPWKPLVDVDSAQRLAVEVEILRVKTSRRVPQALLSGGASLADSSESNVDSGTDESSIKARGASISEALTNSPKTNKASIISRMARMGQATLPLKGAVVANPSDSEETEEESSVTKTNSSTPPTKSSPRTKVATSKPRTPYTILSVTNTAPKDTSATMAAAEAPTAGSLGGAAQHMTVYQSTPVGWHQQHVVQHPQYMINGVPIAIQSNPEGQLYSATTPHQVIPVAPVISTPSSTPSSETHMAVYLAENRTHNAEVRMGLNKVIDKVDQALVKLEGLQQQQRSGAGLLDPHTLLQSLQKLVSDNDKLHAELADKRAKLEQQSEKMYQLLHQKCLEQSGASAAEQTVIMALQQEKAKLAADLNEALAQINSMKFQVGNMEQLKEDMGNVTIRLQAQQLELDQYKKTITDQEGVIRALKERNDAALYVNQSNENEITTLKAAVRDLEAVKVEQEVVLKDAQQKIDGAAQLASQQVVAVQQAHRDEITKLRRQVAAHENEKSDDDGVKDECIKRLENENEELNKKIKSLESEHEELNKKLKYVEEQLKATQESSVDVSSLAIEEVKKIMNAVYKVLKPEFVPETKYEGAAIRGTILSTIQEVTLQYVKVKTKSRAQSESEEVKESADKKQTARDASELAYQASDSSASLKPEPSISTCDQNLERTDDNAASEEKLKEEVDVVVKPDLPVNDQELTEESKPNSETPIPKIMPPAPPATPPLEEDTGSKEMEKEETRTENEPEESSAPKSDQQTTKPREPSLDRGWRPQPPPSPLFDDEEDDDDWLS